MAIDWSHLTIDADEEAILSLRQKWSWMLPNEWTPLLFTAFGDVFLETSDGVVSWLDTGTGTLETIAETRHGFQIALDGAEMDKWFLPALIDRLRREGKVLRPGQCYSYTIFPIFLEGKYETDNIWICSTKEHLGLSGDLHRQISSMPDGKTIKIVIEKEPTRE